MTAQEKIIKQIRQYLSDKPVRKVWLFGSYARNEQHAESDIDLLLDIDFSYPIGWDYFAWWDELEQITGKSIDFVNVGNLSKYITDTVEKEKILIYEKTEAQ